MSRDKGIGIWMPLFIKDRRARTSTMTHVEHSALDLFEMLLWEGAGSVRNDDKMLAKALRVTPRQWSAIKDTILEECIVANGFIRHEGIEREVGKARTNQAQKVAAGKASAEARKGNGRSTDVATDVQPRAGGGGGEGGAYTSQTEEELVKGKGSYTHETGFRSIDGGRK